MALLPSAALHPIPHSTLGDEAETVLVVLSGGLDSTTAAYQAHRDFPDARLHCLSFDYGQRHAKELIYARDTAERLAATFDLVDLRSITSLLKGSALTDPNVSVPEGHYADENMRVTVVPNRNMVMLSIAGAVAVAERVRALYVGIHAGDHAIYPDCRPEFIQAFTDTLQKANVGFIHPLFTVETPFLYWAKADIARRAHELSVPIASTWSCYVGGEIHCGRCATCVERREALEFAGVPDLTAYSDRDYWRTAVGAH